MEKIPPLLTLEPLSSLEKDPHFDYCKGETEDDERSLLATVIEGALEQLGSLIDGGRVAREEAIQSYTYFCCLFPISGPFSVHFWALFLDLLGFNELKHTVFCQSHCKTMKQIGLYVPFRTLFSVLSLIPLN